MWSLHTPVGTVTLNRAVLLVLFVIALLWPVIGVGDFLLFLGALFLAFGLYGASFDLLYGYTGLLSFGHSVFFGVGAYAATFALMDYGQGAFVGLLVAFFATILIAVGLGLIAVRVKSHGFVIVTILIALIAQRLAETYSGITGGTDGIVVSVPDIWIPLLGEYSMFDPTFRYYFILGVVLVSLFLMYRLVISPVGLVFRMIRENEQRARMLGYNVTAYKLIAFVASGAFAGIAGALATYINGFINASRFSLIVAGDPIIYTMLGGRSTIVGAVVGAVLIEGAGNYVSQVTDTYQLIVGLLLLVMVVVEPDGLIGLWNRLQQRVERRVRDSALSPEATTDD
jgi:branched-chain amino acid transport system permease protein